MKISYNWLKSYFANEAPRADEVQTLLNFHSFEVESVEQLGDDTLYDVKVLPNRAHDCLSHIGIAKELSAITALPLRSPLYDISYGDYSAEKTAEMVTLHVEDAALVPRAMKRMVLGVQVGPSPAWLVERLTAIGQRSINNIVDATNFLTHELGQPVHAFDYDKLAGSGKKEIFIRTARAGEKITTLDGKSHMLDESMLVISDRERALDVAGIKGGNHSGIDEKTTRVLLSACNFRAVTIRKTSQKLGLRTDASVRFEHELSPEMAAIGMERLGSLVTELAGGAATVDLIDLYPRPAGAYMCGVEASTVNRVLGTELSLAEMQAVLARLGLSSVMRTPIAYVLDLAPTFIGKPYKLGASILYDAPRIFDCSSFVAYLFAQAGMGIPRMAIDQYVFGTQVSEADLMPGDLIFSRNQGATLSEYSKEFLPGTPVTGGVTHVGLYMGDGEVIHAASPSFQGQVVIEPYKHSGAFKDIVGFRRIEGADRERIVVTVPPERLDIRHEYDLVEEIGRIHGYEHVQPVMEDVSGGGTQVLKPYYYEEMIRSALAEKGFSEVTNYSFAATGDIELSNPMSTDMPFLRASLASALEEKLIFNARYADLLGTSAVRIFEIGDVFTKEGERTRVALASSNPKDNLVELLGYSGTNLAVSKANVVEYDLAELIAALPEQISYADLPRTHVRPIHPFVPFSSFPFVSRDIAVFTPEGTGAEAVRAIILENAGEHFLHTRLFDEFTKRTPDGPARTSYAFRLVFQSKERTLTSEEIDVVMKKIAESMNAQSGWQVR